jgi:hypothetical protein
MITVRLSTDASQALFAEQSFLGITWLALILVAGNALVLATAITRDAIVPIWLSRVVALTGFT